MNPAAERLISRRAADVRGQPLTSLFRILDEESGHQVRDHVSQILDGRDLAANTRPQLLQRHDSTSVPISMAGAPLYKENVLAGAVLVLHDMTSEKKYIARLSWQASHDSLTKLANRREFEHRLDKALQRLDQGNRQPACADVSRSRSVQDHQRHLRPRRRRQVAVRGRHFAGASPAERGFAGAAGRR